MPTKTSLKNLYEKKFAFRKYPSTIQLGVNFTLIPVASLGFP